jgi:hypothetical protein
MRRHYNADERAMKIGALLLMAGPTSSIISAVAINFDALQNVSEQLTAGEAAD